ncbi:MAG TPA: replication-relaxation family protein, partial [Chloroflexota bacterium]
GFAGRKPRLYGLTDFGLRYLRQQPTATEGRPFRPRSDRKNPLFVPHDLEVAALWANLQPLLASGQLTGCCWVPERLLRGRKLRIKDAGTGTWLPVVPDAYVELTYPDGAVQCCMVEIDRGTHTLHAFARKLRAFEAYYSSGKFCRHWQRPAFEVLVLTHSAQRLEDLWAASRAVVPADAWSWYSFATFGSLTPATFSGPVWRTLEDRRVSLLYAAELPTAGGAPWQLSKA